LYLKLPYCDRLGVATSSTWQHFGNIEVTGLLFIHA